MAFYELKMHQYMDNTNEKIENFVDKYILTQDLTQDFFENIFY